MVISNSIKLDFEIDIINWKPYKPANNNYKKIIFAEYKKFYKQQKGEMTK